MPLSIASLLSAQWEDGYNGWGGQMARMANFGASSEGGCHAERHRVHLSAQTTRLLQGKVVENGKAEGLSCLHNKIQRGILRVRKVLGVFLGTISVPSPALASF